MPALSRIPGTTPKEKIALTGEKFLLAISEHFKLFPTFIKLINSYAYAIQK